jgi:hypothetical protein
MSSQNQYCLDANVLIMGWRGYYAPTFFPGYWEMMSDLGRDEIIFLPQAVADEIHKTDDDLSEWLKRSNIPVQKIDSGVTESLKNVYLANPLHKHLVDNIKQRSLADPWVIAHAMSLGACVVTKENKERAINSPRIKIPNVCENLGIRCIDDFQLIHELGLEFFCQVRR